MHIKFFWLGQMQAMKAIKAHVIAQLTEILQLAHDIMQIKVKKIVQ